MVRMILASFQYTPMQRWGPVSPHGVGTAVGFLAGAILMARRAEPRGIPRAEVYNAVTWGAVGALIGARGFYVLGHLSQFTNVRDVVAVWQGGLTMFGGFLGGLVLGLWYLRRHGFDIVPALDAAAPGFAVGVLIGRIGDIIIADHLGHATNFFLGYKIPSARLAPGYGPPLYVPGAVVHHTALYDFAGTLVLLGFLYLLDRKKLAPGSLFATFSLWYGLQRFAIDFTRNRQLIESHFFGLSGSQWAGLAFAVAGAVALWRLRGRAPVTAVPVEAAPELAPVVPAQLPDEFPAPPPPEAPRPEAEQPALVEPAAPAEPAAAEPAAVSPTYEPPAAQEAPPAYQPPPAREAPPAYEPPAYEPPAQQEPAPPYEPPPAEPAAPERPSEPEPEPEPAPEPEPPAEAHKPASLADIARAPSEPEEPHDSLANLARPAPAGPKQGSLPDIAQPASDTEPTGEPSEEPPAN